MKIKYFINFSGLFILLISVLACDYSKKKPSDSSLKDISSFPIGTAIKIQTLMNDTQLQKLQIKNFNSITATSDMKMNAIMPAENSFNWKTADTILYYAEKNKQRLFGHNLIWHSSTPKWVEKKGAKDSIWLDEFMKEYIQTYVVRYKGKVAAWDVVNEAIESSGGNYRETFWYKKLGKSYIEKAFIYAHEADPDAVLFYNDFNIERDTTKLHAVLNMVNEFKDKGVPISGIGFQMHIRMDISDEIIAYSLKKAADTGLQIHLSEVDIIFNTHNDERLGGIENYSFLTNEMKQAQAEKYKNLIHMYKTIVPKEQQFGITFWDFTDRDSWIKGFFNMKDWPCIYDDDLQPKPAYFGVLDGLKE
jgi:endo-1,4-beta-xylanase